MALSTFSGSVNPSAPDLDPMRNWTPAQIADFQKNTLPLISGSKTSSNMDTSTSSTSVPDWAVPFFQQYMQSTFNLAQQPYTPYTGQTVANLNPFQVQGLNAQATRAINGSPVMDAANTQLQKTINGGYLNSNPYLSGMVNQATNDVMTAYAPIEARSGSFGNSGVNATRDKALAEAAMGMRFNDYTNERNRMMSGLSLAPTVANQDYIDAKALQDAGKGFQNQQQLQMDDQYKRFLEARDYPYKQLQTMGQGLNMNTGSTTTTQTPGTSPWATGFGTAASVYSLLNNNKSPTVICTELHRQGFMPDDIYRVDQAYGSWLVKTHPQTYAGYFQLAQPIVAKMQKSRIFAQFVWLLAKPWAEEMASRMGKGKGSKIGKLIFAVGFPLCTMVGKKRLKVA